jgi:hypothetical protein
MVHHLVMIKFKPKVTEEQIEALERSLDDLPNRIVEIYSYEFGRDVLQTERSYDFGLISLFANPEALQRYQEHGAHLKVLKQIRELAADIRVVDFETRPLTQIERPGPFDDI